jgi:protein ImuA
VEASPAFSADLFAPLPVGAAVGASGIGARRGAAANTRAPEDFHPAVWRASQVGLQRGGVLPSGFAELDAALPGGGWPAQVLTELLLPHAGIGEVRLLAPALAAVQELQRSVIFFDPPALPFAWALQACGLDLQQLFVVRSRAAARGRSNGPLLAADVLWALEQALKSGHVGAVLAWLPARLPADALRRLQLAAQGHEGPAFLLRDEAARHQPSAAPLRLLLRAAAPDALRVQLLKRRGPPLAQALTLRLPPVLPPALVADSAPTTAVLPAAPATRALPS